MTEPKHKQKWPTFVKITIRVVAALASALAVISGFLFYMDSKQKKELPPKEEGEK